MPKPKVQPVSAASRPTISIWRRSRMSAAFKNRRCLAPGGVFHQAGKALAAASTARLESSRVDAGMVAIVSPVNGLRSGYVVPLDAATHSPLMNCRYSFGVVFAVAFSSDTTVLIAPPYAPPDPPPEGEGEFPA